jgi:hypothetical protein
MTKLVSLEVSDTVYQQAEALAQTTHRSVEELLAERLEGTFDPFFRSDDHLELIAQDDVYHRLHPTLIPNYLGKFVAISEGELLDFDADETILIERIEENYPDTTVLIRQVIPS